MVPKFSSVGVGHISFPLESFHVKPSNSFVLSVNAFFSITVSSGTCKSPVISGAVSLTVPTVAISSAGLVSSPQYNTNFTVTSLVLAGSLVNVYISFLSPEVAIVPTSLPVLSPAVSTVLSSTLPAATSFIRLVHSDCTNNTPRFLVKVTLRGLPLSAEVIDTTDLPSQTADSGFKALNTGLSTVTLTGTVIFKVFPKSNMMFGVAVPENSPLTVTSTLSFFT